MGWSYFSKEKEYEVSFYSPLANKGLLHVDPMQAKSKSRFFPRSFFLRSYLFPNLFVRALHQLPD